MAAMALLSRRVLSLNSAAHQLVQARCISTTGCVAQKENWLDKLLVRKIEPTGESHSSVLSTKDTVFELQTHNLKPGTGDAYLKNYEEYVNLVESKDLQIELKGSWTVCVGDQDQVVHLWKYPKGYSGIDKARRTFDTDSDLSNLIKDRNQYLRQRSNQFLYDFSYWPPVTPREGGNIYEIRSYFLRPGTMIEWGNNWAKAIHFRQANNEAFAGLFSQIGRLYNVHHIWCYKSLEARKENRESAWRKSGWDQVVSYTVPLIDEYHTRILVPNSFSPTH